MKKYYILPGIVGVIASIMSLPYIIDFFENYFHWFTASLAGVLCSMFVGYFIFCLLLSSYFLFRQLRRNCKAKKKNNKK